MMVVMLEDLPSHSCKSLATLGPQHLSSRALEGSISTLVAGHGHKTSSNNGWKWHIHSAHQKNGCWSLFIFTILFEPWWLNANKYHDFWVEARIFERSNPPFPDGKDSSDKSSKSRSSAIRRYSSFAPSPSGAANQARSSFNSSCPSAMGPVGGENCGKLRPMNLQKTLSPLDSRILELDNTRLFFSMMDHLKCKDWTTITRRGLMKN